MLPTPTSFRPESLVGSTLDGRYRLAAHLASGGMGSIFRAEHVYMRKELAVKVLRPDLSTLPDIAERFRREAEIAASLEHDHIVRVTDFGRSPEGWLFLVMELLEGESLFDRLRRSGPVMPEEAVGILVQVCSGLEAAHARGVVHRDLKPENIFLTARPAGLVKLLDFGIAKITDPGVASDTQAGMVVGTPEYLSPEQALGAAVDGRADVYAVGLIGWRMLAGHHPFKADDARGLLMMQATRPVPPLLEPRPDLAAWPGLVAALARACQKEIPDRPSAAELRAELEAAVGSDVLVHPAVTRARSRPWSTPSAPAPVPSPAAAPAAEVATTAVALASPSPSAPVRTLTADSSETTVTLAPAPLAAAPARRGLLGFVRAHALALALLGAAGAAYPGSLAVAHWLEERPLHRARALLEAHEFEAARELLAPAVVRRPTDARLRVLQGRALHRTDGGAGAAVDAYAAALDLDPGALDGEAWADLAGNLAREPALAERSAKVLVRGGAAAAPAVLALAREGPPAVRLRALELARALGAEDGIDRVAAWRSLLEDQDCDVRRAASKRLGELGSRAALPRLQELARQTRPIRGLLGSARSAPACGAAEAEAAVRRIEAASPAASR